MATPKPFPVIPGVYVSIIEADTDARPVSNVFSWVCNPAPTLVNETANALTIATSIATRWGAVVGDLLHETYVGNSVKVYALGDPLLPPRVVPMVANGGDTSAQHFLQTAGVIRHTVYRRGKGSQSHTRLSPIGSDAITVNGDQMIPLWVTRATSHFHDFEVGVTADFAAATGSALSLVQLSKQTFGGVYGKIFTILESEGLALIGSQKRRLGR